MPGYSFGAWLRRRRKGLDLTREALGRRVGYSAAAIRKIEAEERLPSPQLATALAELFGIPEEQRAAFVRFSRGELLAAPPAALAEGIWVSPSAHVPPLPAATTSFVGREQDLAAARSYLAEKGVRLVTLIGPPGIGKTRLSLEVARATTGDFDDGVYFVPLAPLAEPVQVAQATARTLGLVERVGRPDSERLQSAIGERELLLIMDNAEHLVEAVAELVAALLPSCPRLKILCTSRESLRVPGEWLYPLPPLALPQGTGEGRLAELADFPALRLFVERARTVQPDFALTADNTPAVIEICRELDGLPLAIELIAAKVRLQPPAELLVRLNSGFTLSADGRRGVPVRHKSLHEAIAWSYDLLSLAEQQLLAGLSVFAGGFTLEAVESIFGPEIDGQSTADLLSSLIDNSLVQRITTSQGEARLLLLVTIRQFAEARLQERAEEPAQRDRHLAYFLELAERAEPELHGPEQIAWLNRVAAEFDNFRVAMERALLLPDGRALQLLAAIARPFFLRGYSREGRGWFDRVLLLPGAEQYPLSYARLLIQIGRQSWLNGAFDEALAVLAKAESVATELGDAGTVEMGHLLIIRGSVFRSQATDSLAALPLFEEAVRLFERSEDPRGVALALFHLGRAKVGDDKLSSGQPLLERSLALFQEHGDSWGIARVSHGLGDLYLNRGDVERARHYYAQQLALDEALQFRQGTAVALLNLGDLNRFQGNYFEARHYYEEGLLLCRNFDLPWDDAYLSSGLGLLALQQDDFLTASRHFKASLRRAADMNHEAAAAARVVMLAAVAAGANQPDRAARLYGAGDAPLAILNDQIPAFDRAQIERHIDQARAQLGEERFVMLADEGSRMKLDEAIAYAMEEQF